MSSRKRSVVWMFFKKSTEESTLAECVLCGVPVAHSNTSNLLEHLRGKHRGETSELWNEELNADIRLTCLDGNSSNATKQCPKTEHDEQNLGSDTNMQCGETSDHLGNDELDIEIKQKRLDETATGSIKLDSTGNRKCRSVVWMCFEKSGDNAASAVCTLCGKSIRQVCGSTSNLLKHLLNKHPIEHESIVSDRSLTISCESFPVEKESPVIGRCSGLKRRSRSILWEYFMKNSADESQVICSFCGRMLKQPVGSTSNLIKHLYAKHRDEYQKLYPNENLAYDVPLAKSEALELHSTGMQMQYVELDELECRDPKEGQYDDNEEEEEDGEEVDASIPELFTRVQHIWLKHCEEREKEFIRFMTTKRKEMIQIQESVQKLKQQMALLSKDVRLQESKRKVELKRQERMDRQFLNQKEATARKQKYSRTFRQACNLVKGIQYDQTSFPNPVATGKETKAYEDIVNEVTLDSDNVLIEPCTADTVGTETDSMDTVAMDMGAMDTVAVNVWPVSTLSQHSTSGSNNSQVVILPLNKTETNGWTSNTIAHASKRQKIKSETVVGGLKQDCNQWS